MKRLGVAFLAVLMVVTAVPASGSSGVWCGGRRATIVGTPGDDVILWGTEGPDVIHALGGDDVVRGDAGADIICGGGGNDSLMASNVTSFDQPVYGEPEYTRQFLYGGRGHDSLWANDGADIVSGGPGKDTLHGHGGDDRLFGGSGRDWIHAGKGDDVLRGGRGSDPRMTGGHGNDIIDGDLPRLHDARGNDGVEYQGEDRADGGVVVDLRDGTAVTGHGTDILRHIEVVKGSGGDDVIRGTPGPDILWGGGGDDVMVGRRGDDELRGLTGWDVTRGGRGRDGCEAQRRHHCEYQPAPVPGQEN